MDLNFGSPCHDSQSRGNGNEAVSADLFPTNDAFKEATLGPFSVEQAECGDWRQSVAEQASVDGNEIEFLSELQEIRYFRNAVHRGIGRKLVEVYKEIELRQVYQIDGEERERPEKKPFEAETEGAFEKPQLLVSLTG